MDFSRLTFCFLSLLILSPGVNAAPDDGARVRITQHQASCCYMEGSVSFVELKDAAGTIVASRQFDAEGMMQPVIDQRLPPGTYTIASWQRPCNGNCGNLDAVADACTASFTVEANGDLFVTAAFAPRAGCTLTQTLAAPATSVPDRVAFRREYQSCGIDSFNYPWPGMTYPVRECFAAANRDAGEAEMRGGEASTTQPDSVDAVIYITHGDRSIEVFKRIVSSWPEASWQHYTCTGLIADDLRVFTLGPCTEPEILQ